MDTPDFWARWAKVNDEKDLRNRVYRVSDDPVMVNNNCVVLDAGQFKFLPEPIIMGYDKEIWKLVLEELNEQLRKGEIDAFDHYHDTVGCSDANRNHLCKKYMRAHGIKPFIPFLTFNISPNWGDTPKGVRRIKLLQIVIEKFFGISKRFEKIEYTIECGSTGEHIHAHVVAFINPMFEKTVITQNAKGNLLLGLRKIWDKEQRLFVKDTKWDKGAEPYIGCLKGKYAIQTSLFRKKEFLQDKLDYLDEEKKPEDHRNLRDLGLRKSLVYC